MEPIRKEKTRSEYKDSEALVFFINTDEIHWWDHMFRTREGFRHCFMLQWCEWSQRWMMIDWRQKNVDCMILFDFEAQAFMGFAGTRKGTVVKCFPKKIDAERGPLISYCSSLMARYLGFGDRIILTPWRLYRMLTAAGGEVVYRWSDENGKQAQEIQG